MLVMDIWVMYYFLCEKLCVFYFLLLLWIFQYYFYNGIVYFRFYGKLQYNVNYWLFIKCLVLFNELFLVFFLVCVDLIVFKFLRVDNGVIEGGDFMEWGFFQCIVKELGGFKFNWFVLLNLGDGEKCNWFVVVICFSKNCCYIFQVVLYVDLFSVLDW